MNDFKHQLPDDISEGWKAYGYTGWRPTMSLPYYVGIGLKKAKCGCGKKFKTDEEYYAHYLYKAVWELESFVLPSEWKDSQANTKPRRAQASSLTDKKG